MRLICFITFLILLSVTGYSNTLNVPGSYATIQDAINAAIDGDTVLVGAGTYHEQLDYLGKKITLTSVSGPELTIIDGDALNAVISFINGETRDAVLDGFTVTNGDALSGGGICCKDASPTLINNLITKNAASMGGGIFCDGGAPLIEANHIYDNEADKGGGISCRFSAAPLVKNNRIRNNFAYTHGGGVECYDNATPTIQENIIDGNYNTYTFSYGGGVYCSLNSSAHIVRNLIQNNSTLLGGGGIYDSGSSPIISQNIIIDNEAVDKYGGGINSENYTSAVIVDNIVAHNHAGADGGGIYTWYTDTTTITNCTIVANTCGARGGGLYAGAWVNDVVTNTIIWNNTGVTGEQIYVGEGGSPGVCTVDLCDVKGGPNSVVVSYATLNWGVNYDTDPLFVDEAGYDYHLKYASPLRDLGTSLAPSLSAEDFERDPRIVNNKPDIGADERHVHLYIKGEAKPGQAVNLRVIGEPGKQTALFFSSGVLSAPMLIEFGYWHLKFPAFTIPMGKIPATGLIDLPVAIPSNFPTPATIYLQCIVLDTLTNLSELEIQQ